MIDLRALQAFLTVAETLHFGRAAAALSISQPTLSQRVRRLERQLGVVLFERTSRHVALTDAGQALVGGARRVLVEAERAERQCVDAAQGGAGQLSVGSIGAGLNSVVPPIVARLRRARPGVAVQLRQLDTPLQVAALRDGRLDVGIVRSAAASTGITLTPLLEEPMMVVVPADHRLAEARQVQAADLRDELFVLWPRSSSEAFHDHVLSLCRSAGFAPRVVMEGTDVETQLGLVSAGVGVSLQPASFAALRRLGVVFIDLPPDAPTSQLQLAQPTLPRSPVAAEFARIAHDVARELRWPRRNRYEADDATAVG